MMTRLQDRLSRPLVVGGRTLASRVILAPMAGLGHIALRHLIAEFGGFGLLFTGMCSAKAVPHENPRVSPVFTWRPEELPFTVCQIFGPEPAIMARAARRIEKEGFFGVDINFGCSVAGICKKGAGAALLREPDKAVKIVEAVREAVKIPVFVKYRTGWENRPEFAADLAGRFRQAGADALTFHPRVAPDRRNRPPDWKVIGLVQRAVDIPVFGNGNLFAEADGLTMLEQTGCQGLAIGRMAVARPWIFAQWKDGLIPDNRIYFKSAHRLTCLLEQHYKAPFNLKLFKKIAPYFCANFKFGQSMLKRLVKADTLAQVRENLDDMFQSDPPLLSRPNPHLFL